MQCRSYAENVYFFYTAYSFAKQVGHRLRVFLIQTVIKPANHDYQALVPVIWNTSPLTSLATYYTNELVVNSNVVVCLTRLALGHEGKKHNQQ